MKTLLALITVVAVGVDDAAAQQPLANAARSVDSVARITGYLAIKWGASRDDVVYWLGGEPDQEEAVGPDTTWLLFHGDVSHFLAARSEDREILDRWSGKSASLLVGVHTKNGFFRATVFVPWLDPAGCQQAFMLMRAVVAGSNAPVTPVDAAFPAVPTLCDDFRAGRRTPREGPITFWHDRANGAIVEMSLRKTNVRIDYRIGAP